MIRNSATIRYSENRGESNEEKNTKPKVVQLAQEGR